MDDRTRAERLAEGGRKSRRPPFQPNPTQATVLAALTARRDRGAETIDLLRDGYRLGIPLRTLGVAAGISYETVRRRVA